MYTSSFGEILSKIESYVRIVSYNFERFKHSQVTEFMVTWSKFPFFILKNIETKAFDFASVFFFYFTHQPSY